jgi:hypothetical protein
MQIGVWPPYAAAPNYFYVQPLSDLNRGVKLNWHGKLVLGGGDALVPRCSTNRVKNISWIHGRTKQESGGFQLSTQCDQTFELKNSEDDI